MLLEFAEKDPDFISVRWLAYALATVQRETGISGIVQGKRVPLTFNPITELGGRSYFNRYEGRRDLGNNQAGDGFLFRGRGYVQITGRRNYTEFERLTGEKLASNPDLALTPKVAWEILSTGMRDGIFVPGQTLQRYIPVDDKQKADYFTARKIINPGEIRSKPGVVREMADHAVRWEAILRAAILPDVIPPKKKEKPVKKKEKPVKPDEKPGKEPAENPFDFVSGSFNGICFPDNGKAAKVEGEIGGESQAVYVTHFQKGTKVKIEISSDGKAASFSVNDRSFETVNFGKESNKGQTWTGVIPASGAYYISVTGHSNDANVSAIDYELTVERK
jgi:hypothetical protein